jgi:hypothetical protein
VEISLALLYFPFLGFTSQFASAAGITLRAFLTVLLRFLLLVLI